MLRTGNHGFSWFFHILWYVYPVDKIVHHQPAAGVQDKVQFGSQQHLTFFHVTLENCQRFEISWSSKFPVKKMVFFFERFSRYPIDDGFHRISPCQFWIGPSMSQLPRLFFRKLTRLGHLCFHGHRWCYRRYRINGLWAVLSKFEVG